VKIFVWEETPDNFEVVCKMTCVLCAGSREGFGAGRGVGSLALGGFLWGVCTVLLPLSYGRFSPATVRKLIRSKSSFSFWGEGLGFKSLVFVLPNRISEALSEPNIEVSGLYPS
jgi:hypothetical protein